MDEVFVNKIVMMTDTFSQTGLNLVVGVYENQSNQVLEITETLPHEYMPAWGYTASAVVLFLIGFFGFSLNLIVIVVMCKDIQIWTPMNTILLNLVCSDFSVSIIGNPFTLSSAIQHGWIFGETVCVAYGFFMSWLGITSITTLTVLAYERYCLVSCPFSSAHLSNRDAKYAVGFIWLYSFAITSPPLFGWGKYVSEAANISCSVNWESQTQNATSYIVFLFIFGLVVPVIVICYSYTKIIMTMSQNNLRSGRVNKLESRVTAMIFVMIIAFLVAWMPYSIFALIEQFGDPNLITPAFAVLPALIAKSSICYNPLVYAGMNSQFRAAWKRVRGKEKPQMTHVNETTINQISNSSSHGYVECSFKNFDKKKRNQKKQNNNRINLKTMKVNTVDEPLTEINNIPNCEAFNNPPLIPNDIKYSEPRTFLFVKDLEKKENLELRLFSSEVNIYGHKTSKTMNHIIRANSYKSNIC